MAITAVMVFFLVIGLLIPAGLVVLLVFAVRALIRYNAQVNGRKDRTREEMDRMHIEDL